jgi:hypothetical protein
MLPDWTQAARRAELVVAPDGGRITICQSSTSHQRPPYAFREK